MSCDWQLLVLNLGLRSIRSIVFDKEGNKLAHSWLPVKTILKQEKVEQDPNEWWQLGKRVIRESLDKLENPDIRYITVTSSSACLVPLDKEGIPTHHSLMVSDKRSSAQAEALRKDASLKDLFAKPNFLPVSSFMFPKIMWLKAHEEDVFEKTRYFVSSNDFINYRFTGKLITDPLNAEKFYYDTETGSYPKALLTRLGLGKEKFPKVKEVGTVIGPVQEDVAKELNLSQETEVVLTTYDALCAFWGSGVTKEGQANNVCGTCSSIRAFSTKEKQGSGHLLLSQRFSNLDAFVVGGSNSLEGGLLEWAKSCFYGEGYFNQQEFLFQLMQEEAKDSIIGAEGLIFLPHLIGERAPFHDEQVRGVFFGLERKHTRKEIIRSIFESIGFLTKLMVEAIETSGHAIHELRVSGGLAKNPLIGQLKADITGKNTHLLDELETTSFGAFLLSRISTDPRVKLEDFANKVKIRKTFFPDKDLHEKYNKIYKLFKTIYEHNKDNFHRRNAIFKEIYDDRVHVIDNL